MNIPNRKFKTFPEIMFWHEIDRNEASKPSLYMPKEMYTAIEILAKSINMAAPELICRVVDQYLNQMVQEGILEYPINMDLIKKPKRSRKSTTVNVLPVSKEDTDKKSNNGNSDGQH